MRIRAVATLLRNSAELFARAAADARAGRVRAEAMLRARILAERVRLGVLPAESAPKVP